MDFKSAHLLPKESAGKSAIGAVYSTYESNSTIGAKNFVGFFKTP